MEELHNEGAYRREHQIWNCKASCQGKIRALSLKVLPLGKVLLAYVPIRRSLLYRAILSTLSEAMHYFLLGTVPTSNFLTEKCNGPIFVDV